LNFICDIINIANKSKFFISFAQSIMSQF